MLAQVTDYIFVTKVIDKDTCNSLITDIQSNNIWTQHQWQRYGEVTGSDMSFPSRDCDVSEPTDPQCFQMNEYISKAVTEYNLYLEKHAKLEHFTTTSGATRVSKIRFNRYSTHSMMVCHHDHIHTLFDGTRKGIPILSIVILLNDNFEGGEFVFFDDHEIKLSAGDILLFPSNFLFPHRVNKVIKGTRFSAVAWAW